MTEVVQFTSMRWRLGYCSWCIACFFKMEALAASTFCCRYTRGADFFRNECWKKNRFFLLWHHKKIFFPLIYVFLSVESKSDVHFRRPESETLYNPEKTKISWLSGVHHMYPRIDTGFRFCRSKNPWVVSHQSEKFPLSQNIRIDKFACHAITVSEKRLKTPKMKVLQKELI